MIKQTCLCLQVEFYYFGASIFYETVTISSPKSKYSLNHKIFTSILKNLKDAVIKDMERLSESEASRYDLDEICSGHFQSLDDLPCTYIYIHLVHVSFSSVKTSAISGLFKIYTNKMEKLPICDKHQYHDTLEPYFYNNYYFKLYIERSIQGPNCDSNRQAKLLFYKELLKECSQSEETDLLYESKLPVANWKENDWNVRLCNCIKGTYKAINTYFTARKGLKFDSVQSVMSNGVNLVGCYFFRGAPDIIINKTSSVVTSHREEEELPADDSSDDENVTCEQSFQRNPLRAADRHKLPEKFGELIASLHFLLICKILRKLSNQRNIHKQMTVQGLFIDKMIGCLQCKLTANISKPKDKRTISIKEVDATGTKLDSDALCYHFHELGIR